MIIVPYSVKRFFIISIIFASSDYSLFRERGKAVTNDDVVEELDAEQFSTLLEPAGDLDVLPARRGVQRRVVV